MNESPFRRAWLIFRRRYLIFFIGFLSGCLGYAAARYTVLNANIIGSSMEPALYDGECTAGIRVHDWMNIGRGDIISFHPPFEEDGTLYVKRIIGLPGETVIIKDGKIYIDGSDTPFQNPTCQMGGRYMRALMNSMCRKGNIWYWGTTAMNPMIPVTGNIRM